MKLPLLSAVLLAALATAALAGPPAFEALDADGAGFVTREEAQAARAGRGDPGAPEGHDGAERFAQADANGDGGLSAEELVAQRREEALARAGQLISRADANGDGLLQIEEMRGARGGPEGGREGRAGRLFDRLDTDGDGRISQAEFDAGRDGLRERRGERGKQGPDHAGETGGDLEVPASRE